MGGDQRRMVLWCLLKQKFRTLFVSFHIVCHLIVNSRLSDVSDYQQSLRLQNLNEEKQNIQFEVVRGGRRIEISIFKIVGGDVIPLKFGDQNEKWSTVWEKRLIVWDIFVAKQKLYNEVATYCKMLLGKDLSRARAQMIGFNARQPNEKKLKGTYLW